MQELKDCPYCGAVTRPQLVYEFYHCGRCKRNIDEICQNQTEQKEEIYRFFSAK